MARRRRHWFRTLPARIGAFFRHEAHDREFARELDTHLDHAIADLVATGVSPLEARRRALSRLGSLESAKQLHREARGLPGLDAFLQDVRYGVRVLARQPGFTAAAVATLAIGIGATTAMFSVVNASLLRPLPYPNADRLVDVRTRYVDGRVTTGMVASVELESLRSLDAVVESVAGYGGFDGRPVEITLLRDGAPPLTVGLMPVGQDFFTTFGLPMTLGRAFTAEEHKTVPGQPAPVIVLSHRTWRTLLGSDPAIVGKTLRFAELGTNTAAVVGVASPLLDTPRGPDLWSNLRLPPRDASHNFSAVVRLRPGVSVEQLASAANIALVELARTVPEDVGREYILQSYLASVVGDLRPVLLVVLGATALLLMLACVNVANLLLARGVAQSHEVALRAALGASRGRVISQLITQSMVLATAGSAVGLLAAAGAVRLLTLLAPDLPRLDVVPFDWRVWAVALAVLLGCGLVTGLVPALRLAVTDIKTVLAEGGRRTTSSRGTSQVMSGMIIAEIALAIALVAGAGWLIQSFQRLRSTDPGFEAAGRLLVDVRAARTIATTLESERLATELVERIRAAAGDAVVGAASSFPLDTERDGTTNIELATEAPDPTRVHSGRVRIATAGFFEAMGIRPVAGRTFTADDRRNTEMVAIVNRAFARRYFPDRDPVGAVFAHGYPTPDREHMVRVVGVVDDLRYRSLSEDGDDAAFYIPLPQFGWRIARHAVVVAPAAGVSDALIAAIREELRQLDPLLVPRFIEVPALVAGTLVRQQLGMTLMLAFGATAIVLSAIGLYGVIAYGVGQRRAELATRVALGASGAQVFWLVMGRGQRLMAVGLVLGLGLAHGAGRLVSSSVFAMRAADPWVLSGAAVTVAVVAWLATTVPALRASRQDPVQALRAE